MSARGAPKGNQNASRGRETTIQFKTRFAFKGAAKAAAPEGDLTVLAHTAIREWIERNRPDVIERFPEAFKDGD